MGSSSVIRAAEKRSGLRGRIPKPYLYFDDDKKDRISDQYPRLAYKEVFAKQIPWFIGQQIKKIAEVERRQFTVLIISPTKRQSQSIVSSLRGKGFANIEFAHSRGPEEPTFLEGLTLLLGNAESNLGWRIVSKALLNQDDFDNLLHETENDLERRIIDIVDVDHRKVVQTLLASAKKIRDDREVDDRELDEVLKRCGLEPQGMAKDAFKSEISAYSAGDPAIRNIPVRATTIQGSKGLAAEYVFITQFEDRLLIKDQKNVSDQEICSFLVALTRAQRKLFLISSEKKDPTFLKWINEERIERL